MTRLAALIFCLILLLPVPSALAHALLVDAMPGDGAVIPQAPAQVKLRFNEPVTPVVLRVQDTDGHAIGDNVPSGPEADTLTLPLPADLAAGTYVVSYRVISQDSHAVGGTVMLERLVDKPTPAARAVVGLTGASIAVEMFAWSDRHHGDPLAEAFHTPGREIQRLIATKEPTPEQLEVGVAALAEILRAENGA